MEVDAIPTQEIRRRTEQAILSHIDIDESDALLTIEERDDDCLTNCLRLMLATSQI
jgi:hypothetical protein